MPLDRSPLPGRQPCPHGVLSPGACPYCGSDQRSDTAAQPPREGGSGPSPVQPVTVGQLRNWLATFNDDLEIALADGDDLIAPAIALGKGVRSIVDGHYKIDHEGGLFFAVLRGAA